MRTGVCFCDHRLVANDERPSITITLSLAQVDEVVRAASRARAPSVSTLIANSLSAPRSSGADGQAGTDAGPEQMAVARAARADVDPRLSRSLLRGLSLLRCFGPDGSARGIVELAGELGMSPSTAHRYAVTLVELGLLERCPNSRKYRLPGF
jgi:hypothetical protein